MVNGYNLDSYNKKVAKVQSFSADTILINLLY